jgi:RNA polymerase sigma-70 factor (ECF subfamily)
VNRRLALPATRRCNRSQTGRRLLELKEKDCKFAVPWNEHWTYFDKGAFTMLNDLPSLPPDRVQFDARVSDLEDIDELVRIHRSSVLRHAWWLLKDRDLAESVTQDCFLRAFNARALYRGQCSVRTWLLAIATNLVRDTARSRGFRFWKQVSSSAVDVHELGSRLACRQQTAEANLLMSEKLRQVWATVDGLPGKQRTVFLLRFVEEMPVSEIADSTGLNLSTVKSLLYRALRTIRVDPPLVQEER